MTDPILTNSHELSRQALDAGDFNTALGATPRGLLVESLHEPLWRYRPEAAAAQDPRPHQRVTHDLEAQITAIDDDLPGAETPMHIPAPCTLTI